MKIRSVAFGITLALAAATTAHAAGPIVTPALMATGTNDLQCRLVNAGNQDATVLIEIVDDTGVVLASNGPTAVFAGWTQSTLTADSPGVGYCRVSGISKRRARVTLCVRESGGTCIAAVTGAM